MEFIIVKKDLENTEAWCRDLGFTFYVQGIYKTEYTEESIDKSYSSFCKMLEVYKSISPYETSKACASQPEVALYEEKSPTKGSTQKW